MIKFLGAPNWFQNSGLALLSILLFSFIFCLYPFQSGIWFNTEPAMLALFVLAGLAALWLGVGVVNGFLSLERPLHPLLYVLLAWAGLQFVSLPFANVPMRSWMGIPQTGEGGAWHVMLVLITLFIMPLWENNLHKKIILSVAAASLCYMAYLHFDLGIFCKKFSNYLENNDGTPANWPDYLSFIAIYLWIAFASAPAIRTPKIYCLIMLLCCGSLLIAQNISSSIFVFPMLMGMGIILQIRVWKHKPKFISSILSACKFWKILAITGVFIPLILWMGLSQNYDFFPCKETSIATRAIFNQVVLSIISHEPKRLLMGSGWGEFANDMVKYGLVDGLHTFKNGIYKPNSTWLAGTVFHPHNQPMQALLSLGVLGFCIFMLFPVIAILTLRRSLFWWCVPALLGVGALGDFWFLLPQVMPFQALAFSALCYGRPAKIRESYKIPSLYAITCVVLAVLFFASAYQQFRNIKYADKLLEIMVEDPNKEGVMDWAVDDIVLGGDRLYEYVSNHTRSLGYKVFDVDPDNVFTVKDRDWYRNFFALVHALSDMPDAGMRIIKLDIALKMLPFQLTKPSMLDDLKPMIKANLLDTIIRTTIAAPEREDLIAPFLMNLGYFTGSNKEKQITILKKILEVAPKHRSALWLLGSLYEKSDDAGLRTEGEKMKQQAIEAGVDRVYEVTP